MELSFIVSLDGIDKRDINAGKPKRFKNRIAYVGAIVMGDEALLGAIRMKDMDLVLLPKQRLADANPASPNIASAKAK